MHQRSPDTRCDLSLQDKEQLEESSENRKQNIPKAETRSDQGSATAAAAELGCAAAAALGTPAAELRYDQSCSLCEHSPRVRCAESELEKVQLLNPGGYP